MNELTERNTALVPANLTDAIRLAEVMAKARVVPRHLQDSPGDCLLVIEQAMRWQMSPFAVAQATSVISGKMMFEGKLVAAAVETSGAIQGHLDYTFDGEGESRAITVMATRRGETNPRTVRVTLQEARTTNVMWQRQPDQQLVYHGARVWARRWTPAVILGVYSREEMGQVIDAVAEPETAAEPASEAAARPAERPPAWEAPAAPKKPTTRDWIDQIAIRLNTVTELDEFNAILLEPQMLSARERFTGEAHDRLETIINLTANRLDNLPPIVGEEKAQA